jgi:hypothetical protein
MAMREVLESTVERFRIDPAGYACVGLGVATAWLLERQEAQSAPAVVSLASLGLVTGGLVHISNMLDYGRGIEDSLSERGFDRTSFRVRAYCLRQASRVICQKTGYFDEYLNLCATKDNLRYSFLPHF